MPADDYDLPGFEHVYSGKVRDLYRGADGRLLFVASDRISAYDWVLPTRIPDKGAVLTRLSSWWFRQTADIVPNHVLSADVPTAVAGRALYCEPLDMFPVECVVRGYLSGSGWQDYLASGKVCGLALPAGLVQSARLPQPIFTPATKAAVGDHDENITFDTAVRLVGGQVAEALRDLSLAVYAYAERVARQRGLILADTKFEFGRRADGAIVLADEVLTPDSSRFWDARSWQPGTSPPSYDKQYVRDWLTSPDCGWDRHADRPPPGLPEFVVRRTRAKYIRAFETLTGEDFA